MATGRALSDALDAVDATLDDSFEGDIASAAALLTDESDPWSAV